VLPLARLGFPHTIFGRPSHAVEVAALPMPDRPSHCLGPRRWAPARRLRPARLGSSELAREEGGRHGERGRSQHAVPAVGRERERERERGATVRSGEMERPREGWMTCGILGFR
jgi:hypothetical protein